MDKVESLYEYSYKDILRFLRALTQNEYLAEELTQETLYRAIRSIDSFRGDCDIRVWMFSIAKNLFYSYQKKEKKLVYEGILGSYTEQKDIEFVEGLANKEIEQQIHKILHEMKEPYKEVFSLRIFGELSFREIANIFNKSEHWACVTYHRAKEMIKKDVMKLH